MRIVSFSWQTIMSPLESLLVKKLSNEYKVAKDFCKNFGEKIEVSLVRFGYTNVIEEHVDFPDRFLLWDTVRPIQAVGHNFVVT